MGSALRKDRLLFIDTNIFLDFYRARTDAGLRLLAHLDAVRDRVIVTHQIEMEFKRNRQEILVDAINSLKAPPALVIPPILRDSKSSKAAKSDQKKFDSRLSRMRSKMNRILQEPTKHDQVFQCAQRLFSNTSQYNLTRDSDLKYNVYRKATRRFLLGYPPRKSTDTSMGDAVNWEWIIRCCSEIAPKPCDLIIVSRDSDYGISYGGKAYINDQLLREFRDRVSQKRVVNLMHSLADALKTFDVKISEAESNEEQEIISHAIESKKSRDASKTDFTHLNMFIKKLLGDSLAGSEKTPALQSGDSK